MTMSESRTSTQQIKPKKTKNVQSDVISSNLEEFSGSDLGVRKPRVQGFAKVKAVLSGSTLLLVGRSKDEKRVNISGITVPRLAFNKQGVDEPYAYLALKFLQSKVLDQNVHFTINDSTSDREYADVTFNGQDIAALMVSNGFATVTLAKSKDGDKNIDISSLHPEKQALYKLQLEAEKKKLGIFSGAKSNTRVLNWEPDHAAIFSEYKNQPIPGTVVRVLDGSTYKVEIAHPFGSLNHSLITINLVGATAPRYFSSGNTSAPFGLESQQFVETRLLDKDVHIVLRCMDKAGNLYASVIFSKGNITSRLLESGLAKHVPWTAALLPADEQATLQTAVATAIKNKAGIWTSETAPPVKTEYDGTVVQINTGSMIIVKDQFGVEHKVVLASVKVPSRNGDKLAPFAFEAREFLRKSLISKKVRVVVEYTKEDPAKEKDIREFATVYKAKYNVALELVSAGLANVASYTKEVERSMCYNDLIAAEVTAEAKKLGMYSKNAAIVVTDHTSFPRKKRDDKKGAEKDKKEKVDSATTEALKIALPKLVGFQTHAVLEHVYSPTHIKVYIPILHAYVSVQISSISPPPKDNKQVYDAALASIKKYLQQDLVLEVSMLNRADSFVGNVFHRDFKENIAQTLLKNGHATIIPFSADRNTFKTQLFNAEADAKKARRGVWVDYDEEKERLEAEKAKKEAAELLGAGIYTKEDGCSYLKVQVCDVVDPVHFYINNIEDKNLNVVREALDKFVAPTVEDFTPTKGSLIAAIFPEDKSWNRARVESVNLNKKIVSVQYIDFGNFSDITLDQVAPLPEELTKIKPLARPCMLSGLKAPLESSEHYEPGAEAFASMTNELTFEARIDTTDNNGVLHLSLFHESDKLPINVHLIKSGLVRSHPRPLKKLTDIVASYAEYQLEAQDAHYGIWTYGAYTSDMEEHD